MRNMYTHTTILHMQGYYVLESDPNNWWEYGQLVKVNISNVSS